MYKSEVLVILKEYKLFDVDQIIYEYTQYSEEDPEIFLDIINYVENLQDWKYDKVFTDNKIKYYRPDSRNYMKTKIEVFSNSIKKGYVLLALSNKVMSSIKILKPVKIFDLDEQIEYIVENQKYHTNISYVSNHFVVNLKELKESLVNHKY